MYKNEKKILTNQNLEQPGKTVLEKAKSIMPAKPRRKMNARQIIALASSVAVIIAVIVCIPFMLPARQAQTIISTAELSAINVESIADFIRENGLDIQYFADAEQTTAYTYNHAIVLMEQKCTVYGTDITVLVRISEHCKGLSFEKEREYADLLSNAMEYELSESVVEVAEADATVFLTFQKDQNRYYMSLSQKGNDVDWKEILENFLNSPKKNENLL